MGARSGPAWRVPPPPGAVGDVANAAFIVGVVAYLCCIAAYVNGLTALEIFGENWAADGFCLSFTDSAAWHTHLLCLYVDTAAALGLALLMRGQPPRSELQTVRDGIGGTFLHGVVHAYLWMAQPQGVAVGRGRSLAAALLWLGLGFAFYYAFMAHGGWRPHGTRAWVMAVQCAVHAVVSVFFIPAFYLFTYSYAVLYLNGVAKRMIYGIKDRFYDARAVTTLPVMLASWLEPLLCDGLLVHLGGHVWFDLSIPAGAAAYYAITRGLEPRKDPPPLVVPPSARAAVPPAPAGGVVDVRAPPPPEARPPAEALVVRRPETPPSRAAPSRGAEAVANVSIRVQGGFAGAVRWAARHRGAVLKALVMLLAMRVLARRGARAALLVAARLVGRTR